MALGSGEGLTNKGRPLRSEIKDETPEKYPFDEWKASSTRNPTPRARVARRIGASGSEIEGASGVTDAFHDPRPKMPDPSVEVWALDEPLLSSSLARRPQAREFAFAPGALGSVPQPWFRERRWTVPLGLVAAYTMDAGAGSVLRDDSGNFVVGTMVGPGWTNDPTKGWCLSFDGIDDFIGTPSLVWPTTLTEITITFWAKKSSVGGGTHTTFLQASPDITTNRLNVHLPHDGTLYWDFGNVASGGRIFKAWNASWNDTWTHFTFRANSAGLQIYVNGTLWHSGGSAQSATFGARFLFFGKDSAVNPLSFWKGLWKNFRLYTRALTLAEISALYTETSPYEDVYAPPCDNAVWLGKTTTNLVATTDLADSKWDHADAYQAVGYGNIFDSELQKTIFKWTKGSTADSTRIYDNDGVTGFSAGTYTLSLMIKCNYDVTVWGYFYGATPGIVESAGMCIKANTWTLCTFRITTSVATYTQLGFFVYKTGYGNFPSGIEFRACDPYVALESYPMPFVPTTRPAGSLWYNFEWPQAGTVGFWIKPAFMYTKADGPYIISDYNGTSYNFRFLFDTGTDSFTMNLGPSGHVVTIDGTPIMSNADLWKWWFIGITWDIPNDSLKLYCYNADYPNGDNASSTSDLGTITFQNYLSVGGIPLYTSPAAYISDSFMAGLFIDEAVWTADALKAHYEGGRAFTQGGATASGRGAFGDAAAQALLQDLSVGSRDVPSRFRVAAETGETWAQGVYEKTTATGGNVYVGSDFKLLRGGVSAEKYKRDIEDLDLKVADRVLALRPIWYRSLCAYDNPEWSWYGLLAEDVARADPRLVSWGRPELGPVPEGVDYARLSVVLLAALQRHLRMDGEEKDALRGRVLELIERVDALEKEVKDATKLAPPSLDDITEAGETEIPAGDPRLEPETK